MWLYVPNLSTSSPSAPVEPGLISASSWQFQRLEQSVWWRGKPSQSRHWFQRWKRAPFIQLLFGVMPEPSMAEDGVALWTASLAASRASLIASPASASVGKTSEISGRRLDGYSSNPARGSSSSKTSVGCFLRAARNAPGETFIAWAARLREDCSRRQKLATATNANASLSSPYWMTPRAGENDETPEAHHARRMRQDPSKRMGATGTLSIQAKQWQTPNLVDAKGGDRHSLDQAQLCHQVKQWTTPSAGDGQRGGTITDGMSGTSLTQQVNTLYSRPDLMISRVGEAHSRLRRSLNPLFVEWLMGWPPGWTLAAWTDFACSATELSRFKQRMRCALSQLGLPQPAPSLQFSLFG